MSNESTKYWSCVQKQARSHAVPLAWNRTLVSWMPQKLDNQTSRRICLKCLCAACPYMRFATRPVCTSPRCSQKKKSIFPFPYPHAVTLRFPTANRLSRHSNDAHAPTRRPSLSSRYPFVFFFLFCPARSHVLLDRQRQEMLPDGSDGFFSPRRSRFPTLQNSDDQISPKVYCICSEFRISIVVDSVYEISCKVHRCQPIAFVGRSGRVLFSLINKTKTECLCNR